MYELNYERTDGTVALVNVGASSVNINILRGGASAFTRDLAMGGRAYTEEIQRVMGVSYEEAEAFKVGGGEKDRASVVPEEVERVLASVSETLAAEIYRSVDFYMGSAGGGGIGQLWLSGGAAPTPGLQGALARISGANVQVVDPFRRVQVDERSFNPRFLRDVAPQAAIAVGLGLRKADDK